ncbi:MAG: alpha-galactosidase [Bryobacteraceae bacterium]
MTRFLFALFLTSLTAAAQFRFAYNRAAGTWTLQNDVARAVFALDGSGLFSFRSFENLVSNEIWTAPSGTSPIRLQAGAETLDAATAFRMTAQSARSISRNGYRQTIVLEDLRAAGRIQLELEMYAGQPVLRYRVRFRNLHNTPETVRSLSLLNWSFEAADQTLRLFRVNQWVRGGKQGNFETLTSTLNTRGTAVNILSGAHAQHCAWFALRDQNDRGLFGGLEFDGRATTSVKHSNGVLSISTQIPEMNRVLANQEELAGPYAFIGLFHGDWDDAGFRTQRFTEAAIASPMPDAGFPYVIWDSWKYQQNITEDLLRRNAELAARIGVEVFVVDLGWARRIGEWREHPGKFYPGGLRALSDFVHSLGMKFGLHFAFAEAAADSPVLLANPDWRSSETYGYFEADSICLSHTPVRNWVVAEAVRIIDLYGVDWILQDGENMVKRCTKTTHTHHALDSNYANAVDGLNYVVQTVQRRRPNVHWENCEDGGNMMTFNMVRNYVTSIAADDSGPMTTRQAIFGITYPFSPRYADRYMPDEELNTYITRSFMFGGPWIFMNRLERMTMEDLAIAAHEIGIFKRIREHIRDGQVFHLTGRPAENGIDAIESYDAASDRALAFIFRAESPTAQRTLRFRGLKPEQRYRVTFEDDPLRVYQLTGEQLARGFLVRMPDMWSTQLIYVDPIPQ